VTGVTIKRSNVYTVPTHIGQRVVVSLPVTQVHNAWFREGAEILQKNQFALTLTYFNQIPTRKCIKIART